MKDIAGKSAKIDPCLVLELSLICSFRMRKSTNFMNGLKESESVLPSPLTIFDNTDAIPSVL